MGAAYTIDARPRARRSLRQLDPPVRKAAAQVIDGLATDPRPPCFRPLAGVIGLFIWARIDDQRQRSFVTGYPGRPPGFQDHEDIRGGMHAGRRQRVANGGQTSVPWRLSRSVIDSVGLAGAEFARNGESALKKSQVQASPTARISVILVRSPRPG